MKTKRMKWRPPSEQPLDHRIVLCVVKYPVGHVAIATGGHSNGGWDYESPKVGCKVLAWAYPPPIPKVFPWEFTSDAYLNFDPLEV